MLADAIQQVVDREGFQPVCIEQDVEREQCTFFDRSEARENLTCCSGHRVIMGFVHKRADLFNVNDDQDFSDLRGRRWFFRSRISLPIMLLSATVLPHIVVPRTGAVRSCSLTMI